MPFRCIAGLFVFDQRASLPFTAPCLLESAESAPAPPSSCSLAGCWPGPPDCSPRLARAGLGCAGCLARSLSAGPGHCPPDTRLACDVILPPRLSQLESAPCLQQTRASHKPVSCDPSVQHTPAVCSQTRSRAAAPAVISWSSASQGMKPDTRPRKQCLQHFKQLDRAFTILQERRILAFEDFSTDQK